MVDIHCHLVPGVDDGAASLEISLAMIEQAASVGITHIMTTPHIKGRESDLVVHARHQEAFATIISHIRGCEVALGCEVKVTSEMNAVTGRKEFTFAEQKKYLLFELPFESIPAYTSQVLFDLRLHGITPIIAHPERIVPIMKDPGIAVDFVAQGAVLQLTNGCVTGELGETLMAVSASLLEHGLVSMVSSDAHNVTSRTYLSWPRTAEVLEEMESSLKSELGESPFVAMDLTTNNTLSAWQGKSIVAPDISGWDRDDLKQSVRDRAERPRATRRRFFSFRGR